jgi:translation initiation factor 1
MTKLIKKEEVNIVWTDDEELKKNLKIKKTKFLEIEPHQLLLKIELLKNHRGGKVVCLIKDLPHNPPYFQKLVKKLKKQCGTGGTYKNNTIEIQGDIREKLKDILEEEGFKVKLSGG